MGAMRIISQVTDPLSLIPWPAQLSLFGSLIIAIVIILRWQSWQVQKGALVPKSTYDEMVKLKDGEIEGLRTRGDEWKAAHAASEAAREVERETTREGGRRQATWIGSCGGVVHSIAASRALDLKGTCALGRRQSGDGKEPVGICVRASHSISCRNADPSILWSRPCHQAVS